MTTMRWILPLLSSIPLVAGVSAMHDGGGKSAVDPIAEIQAEIKSGKNPLEYEPRQGYLRSLLRRLNVDPLSQVLVFSKSSVQAEFINPKNPRSLYFNDHVYVGWIPGAPLIEVASVDPIKGVIMYTLPNKPSANPSFRKDDGECFRCHGVRGPYSAPNLISNSYYVAPSGYSRVFADAYDNLPTTPIKLRWGGWYVTGSHGAMRHMGNAFAIGDDEKYHLDPEKGANVSDLSRFFDNKRYLSPTSDIVALLVFEHQMDVQNALSNYGNDVRYRLSEKEKVTYRELNEGCQPLLKKLFCSGEVALTSPVKGTNDFAKAYGDRYPKDSQGRSLGELDLSTRLLRYPCSPMVYSASFDALPEIARKQLWRRIADVLSGKDKSPAFGHLSASDKEAITEILKQTKPEFAVSK